MSCVSQPAPPHAVQLGNLKQTFFLLPEHMTCLLMFFAAFRHQSSLVAHLIVTVREQLTLTPTQSLWLFVESTVKGKAVEFAPSATFDYQEFNCLLTAAGARWEPSTASTRMKICFCTSHIARRRRMGGQQGREGDPRC